MLKWVHYSIDPFGTVSEVTIVVTVVVILRACIIDALLVCHYAGRSFYLLPPLPSLNTGSGMLSFGKNEEEEKARVNPQCRRATQSSTKKQ